MGFLPTEYVDISDYIETKLEALSCHKSQLEWMLEHDGIDFLRLYPHMFEGERVSMRCQVCRGFPHESKLPADRPKTDASLTDLR